MINFACQNCAQRLQVTDSLVITRIRCPHCQQEQAVPQAAEVTAEFSPPQTPVTANVTMADASYVEQYVETLAVEATPSAASGYEPTQAEPGALPVRVERIPGYEILGELGRGGMGVVYKARQLRLNRVVALKMILSGSYAGVTDLARFQKEAQALARVQHPNIVQVHEVGEHDGVPFFSLEFCGGDSLKKKLNGTPLPAREAAQLVETLARAMHLAHEQHIIHRDLKPANVLLTENGTPKITDFGLAKKLDEAGETQSGAILGTPSYMAPEQASGRTKELSPATDVYALGTILYECLTGRPPYTSATPMDTVLQVLTEEVVPPKRLNAKVPRDLETICLMCLQKEASKRYVSAAALADDLHRFQVGEPIRARPVGHFERTAKWARRRPAVAALLAVCAVALVGGLLGWGWFTGAIQSERDKANAASQDSAQKAVAEHLAWEESERQKENAQAAQRQTDIVLVDMETSFGLAASEQGRSATAALWFASAARRSTHDPERQQYNRIRFAMSERQAVTPLRAVDVGEEVVEMALHPDAKYLLSRTGSGRWVLWDLEGEKRLDFPGDNGQVTAAAWTTAGKELALGRADGTVEIWSFPRGGRQQVIQHSEPVRALAFSEDGSLLALAGERIRLWSCVKQQFISPEWPHPKAVIHLVFNRSGTLLATSCADRQVRLFSTAPDSRDALLTVAHTTGAFSSLRIVSAPPVFANDGNSLVVIPNATSVACYDSAGTMQWQAETSALQGVWASPDQKTLLVAVEWGLAMLDGRTGQDLGRLFPQQHFGTGAAFFRNGEVLVGSSLDRTVRVWSVANGKPLTSNVPHQDAIQVLAAARNRELFATAQYDGVIRLWRLGEDPLPRLRRDWPAGMHYDLPCTMALSPAGDLFLPITNETVAQVRSLETGGGRGRVLGLKAYLRQAVFAPGSRQVVTLSGEGDSLKWPPLRSTGWVECWDWAEGRALFPPVRTDTEPRGAAFSPDGKNLVVACTNGAILILDPSSGQVRHRLTQPEPDWSHLLRVDVAFHPEGQSFVVGGLGKKALVIDVSSGRILYVVEMADDIAAVAFSRDGRWVMTAATDKEVRFWDAQTGQEGLKPLLHPDWVFQAAFSADGRYLVTACRDRMVRVWDWRTGELLQSLEHEDEVFDAQFSADGGWLASFTKGGSVRLWEWLTGHSLSPALLVGATGCVSQVHFTGGGRRLVGSNQAIFELEPIRRPRARDLKPDELMQLAQLLSGQDVGPGGRLVNLTSRQWLAIWQQFNGSHRGYLDLPSAEKESAERARAMEQRIREAIEKGRWQEAEELILQLLDHDAQRIETVSVAIPLLQKILAGQPDNAAVSRQLADLLLRAREARVWTVLQPKEMRSAGGATLQLQPDGSILAGGTSPDLDTYTMTAPTVQEHITALRLEALPDPSLPSNGPGRFESGNFHLTEISLAIAPAKTPDKSTAVAFRRATGYKRSLSDGGTLRNGPEGAIDGDPATCWDIFPRNGRATSAYFETVHPVGGDGGSTLTIQLDFKDAKWVQSAWDVFASPQQRSLMSYETKVCSSWPSRKATGHVWDWLTSCGAKPRRPSPLWRRR